MVKHYQDADFAWVDYSATSLVLSVLVLPGAVQFSMFIEDKLAEISFAMPECFYHCLGSFQECSCPRITTC